MTQENVNQLYSKRANLPAPAARLVPQTQTVLLDLYEFFVKRQQFRRSNIARGREVALSVCEDFFEMTRNGQSR